MSPKRGVLYLVWGDGVEEALVRSTGSLRQVYPDLPVRVERLPATSSLLDKARMLEITPFDETLYLDADTVVLGNLDYGFERAARFGLACSICECPWARRYGGLQGDTIEYNTGVLFFTRKVKDLFDRWAKCAGTIDSSILFFDRGDQLARMPHNDQAGFAKAVEDTGFIPFVLPYNWNFRPRWHKSFWGPIKIWHDYRPVPQSILSLSEEQSDVRSIIRYAEIR